MAPALIDDLIVSAEQFRRSCRLLGNRGLVSEEKVYPGFRLVLTIGIGLKTFNDPHFSAKF